MYCDTLFVLSQQLLSVWDNVKEEGCFIHVPLYMGTVDLFHPIHVVILPSRVVGTLHEPLKSCDTEPENVIA